MLSEVIMQVVLNLRGTLESLFPFQLHVFSDKVPIHVIYVYIATVGSRHGMCAHLPESMEYANSYLES